MTRPKPKTAATRPSVRTKLLPNSTPVPNFFFDVLAPLVTAEVFQGMLFIWRKTVGWQKESDHISVTQIEDEMGIGRSSAESATALFIACGMFTTSRKGDRGTNRFQLLDYDPEQVVLKIKELAASHPSGGTILKRAFKRSHPSGGTMCDVHILLGEGLHPSGRTPTESNSIESEEVRTNVLPDSRKHSQPPRESPQVDSRRAKHLWQSQRSRFKQTIGKFCRTWSGDLEKWQKLLSEHGEDVVVKASTAWMERDKDHLSSKQPNSNLGWFFKANDLEELLQDAVDELTQPVVVQEEPDGMVFN